MMNGEIWWVDFQEPRGSTPAFVRPGIIVQNNELNKSELNTTVDKQALLEKNSKLSSDLLDEIYEEIFWVLEK